MSLGAARKDAVIEYMEVRITHEHGDVHVFEWTSLLETFSEIKDSDGNRQTVERDQPALAIKVSTALLQEKFVRFQDAAYHERHRLPLDAAAKHQTYLKGRSTDAASSGPQLLASPQFHALLEFYRTEFWWKTGTYSAVFGIKSSNRARLAKAAFEFSLTQQHVDGLHRNLEVMQPNYENVVLAGTDGHEPKPVDWDWKSVPFRKG